VQPRSLNRALSDIRDRPVPLGVVFLSFSQTDDFSFCNTPIAFLVVFILL